MNKKALMWCFINELVKDKKITLFIRNIFNYQEINDYNYLFRVIEENNSVMMDIYDNISDNRFNRYIFSFDKGKYDMKVIQEGNVFVTFIFINKVIDCDNKLLKLAYLFKLDNLEMIDYAKDFLDKEIVEVLIKILKKPIC